MIAIVDYGAGNLTSVLKAFRACGADPRIARAPDELRDASGVVVPGVGHFDATRAIDGAWRSAIFSAVDNGTPLLGICLGMQWLYDGSEEAPEVQGAGFLKGRAFRLTGDVKVPHVGWNTLKPGGDAVYFTHSYAAPIGEGTLATSEHGVPFAAIVKAGTVTGMQFHPEKSGRAGLDLLERWLADAL